MQRRVCAWHAPTARLAPRSTEDDMQGHFLLEGVREGGIIIFRLFTGQPRQFAFRKSPKRCCWSELVSKGTVRCWRAAAIRRLHMYPEEYVQPVREELTRIGFQ